MKKIKIIGLALVVTCVGVIGFTGCTQASKPYDIFVSNAQKEFSIGDEFTLGNNFEVDLQFSSNKTMALDNKTAVVYESTKQIKTVDYTIDYSNFDSSKGGTYNIYVTFNDHDSNAYNDIKISYQVTVNLTTNYWLNNLAVTNWSYGNFGISNVTTPVARYLNSSVEYYYKETSQNNFSKIETNNLYTKLATLDAGNYTLKAICKQTEQYTKIEQSVNFSVLKNVIPSSVIIPENAGEKDYTGSILASDLVSNEYYNVTKGGGNWTDAGQYAVIITPTKNYTWLDSTVTEKIIYFTINKVSNEWTNNNFDVAVLHDDVKGWYVGDTNPYPIFTQPEAKFGTVAYKYKLTAQDDSQYSQPVTLSELLNLSPNSYTIMAYIPSSSNYNDIAPLTVDVIVIVH